MTIDEFNVLVEQAYEAAFAYERELTDVYVLSYERQVKVASNSFLAQTEVVTASWTPPVYQSLSDGMSDDEMKEADTIRDEAALAVMSVFAGLTIASFSPEFLRALSERAQLNFEQEMLRNLRKVVSEGFDSGLTSQEVAAQIRARFAQIVPSSAEMLSQTLLTGMVNERSVAAAQKAFPDGVMKTWLTVGDNKVRPAHAAVAGTSVPQDQPFQVGGSSMQYPGDLSAPLRLTARCRCRLSFATDQSPITAAARPDVSELAMVAVYPTADEAEAISTVGGNPAETMHVTMVFLGDVAEIDLEAAARAVERVASDTAPLSGHVGGIGMFQGGDDGFPQLAIPNVQGLATLRTRLTDALAEEGVVSPSEHDWVPHMTLAYVDEASLPDDMSVIGSPLTFKDLSLTVADVRTDFPFVAPVVASAQEDKLMGTVELHDSDGNAVGILTIGAPSILANDLPMQSSFQPYSGNSSFATITISTDEPDEEDEKMAPMEDGPAWRALLAVEGVATEDGRMLAEGSLTWRDLPLSLTAMDTSNHGAEGQAKVCGRIDRIWRDGLEIWGEGVFNSDEFGLHIAELVSNQSLRGNSIEPAVLSYEIRNAETGEVLEGEDLMDAMMDDVPLLTVFLEAVVMASTVVSTPAIADANIVLASGVLKTAIFTPFKAEDPLTASAAGMAPLHPPAAWFDNPRLKGPTALAVTDEGHVYGHAALWETCHIGEPSGPGVCVPPPRTGMSYEIFHHGSLKTEEGHDISVGQVTMSTFHADGDPRVGWKEAREHYEHTGRVVADVRAGEDRFGIWVSGALRPDLPATKVREMKAGSISGDWRSVIGKGLEFIGALIVNIPGFPIPRPQATIVASANGDEVVSLVAAGMVCPCEEIEGMSRREYLRKIRALAD